jgi:uncharacterized protein YhaN
MESSMIIEKINIKSFGMITDTCLEFSNSINVIEGQNEAGKSTIAAFIKYMLYGFDNEDIPGALAERNKYLNWTTGEAGGTMNVTVKGKRYLISRSTVTVESGARKAYKEENSITDLETGSPAFGKVPAGEVFFGVEKDLFENTAFVGQIGDTSINEGSVKESIENILFSGSEKINNQRAASKVSVKMENLLHSNGMGGVIYDLMRRGDDFEGKFKQADSDNKLILTKEAKLHEIKESRRAEIEKQDKLCDLDVCYRNVLIIQDFDKLHTYESEYEEKNEEYNKFITDNMRSGFVPTNQYLTDIAVARRGVDDAYRNLVDANQRYLDEKNAIGITREIEGAIELADENGGEDEVLSQAKRIGVSQIKNIAAAVGGSLVALAAIVFEIVAKGALAGALARIGFGLVGLAGLAAAAVMVVFFMKNKARLGEILNRFSTETSAELKDKLAVIGEARAKRDSMIRSTENARVALEDAKVRYEQVKAELLEVIVRWGEEPPHSGLNDFLDGLEDKVKAFLAEEKRILDEKLAIEMKVRELRTMLSDKSEIEIRAQVPPFKRKVLAEIDHDAILEGIEECKLKIRAQDLLADQVERELFELKARAIDPGELYSKIQANEAKVEELKSQHKAYYIALRAIENASDNLRLEISPRLGEYSTKLMEIMTNKKYTSFDVSNGLQVTFKDSLGEDKSVDFLSGGTRDLAYIAVRMALIDMLYTEKPPVIFDESFAHQDNIRARSMMRAIKSLADDGHQSFIFTCRARESTLATELSEGTEVFKLSKIEDAVS